MKAVVLVTLAWLCAQGSPHACSGPLKASDWNGMAVTRSYCAVVPTPHALQVTSMRAALYSRVSTHHGQNVETQLVELRAYAQRRGWQITDEFTDVGVSGAKDRRPELDRLMTAVRRQQVDVVLVARFDRFARSVRHLTLALEEFEARGVEFVSTSEAIDTSTALGRALFTIIGAISAFERDLIKDRVRMGLRRARAEGKQIGRPAKDVDLGQALALLAEGKTKTATARALGVSRRTLNRALDADPGPGRKGPDSATANPPGESPSALSPTRPLLRAKTTGSAHSDTDPAPGRREAS